jgi:1,4-alpha-glucan branching enzyme
LDQKSKLSTKIKLKLIYRFDRYNKFNETKKHIESIEGSLYDFAGGYKKFGLNRVGKSIVYREWAPGAQELNLMGEFNNWNWHSHRCERKEYGVWELVLPDNADGTPAIRHGSKIKIALRTPSGEWVSRIPAWCRYVTQEKDNPVYDGVYWESPQYQWKNKKPAKPDRLRIYEAHVGMAVKEARLGTYKEFTRDILPYVKDLGYNCIQLMAIMEHAYYGSFGYQVTNFFAPSSRYGTPEDLKELIDTAHGMGLTILLDVVHSHASKNVADGLNQFDGTDNCYFHEGGRGHHPIWDSRLFNYASWEVQRFLLSNLRYWLEEFGFDGFRFDGVTAMVYYNHGVGKTPMSYEEYFGGEVDHEALLYLTLANHMIHKDFPGSISIAEEVSGLATLCRPVHEGGGGFDYRLGMGIPDKWIELMKVPDEQWNMGNITFTLSNRRYKEETIAYCESHDQALVGDKTIAFWLMDKEMYWEMTTLKPLHPVIDRGMSLHKMIRLMTIGLGGEGYLTFMGNEFGHPEWIDFPRLGNNWDYHHARRRWDLVHDPLLRYKFLHAFDRAMIHLEMDNKFMKHWHQYVSLSHESDKVAVFEKNDLLFAFNFHHSNSYSDYKIGVEFPGKYKIVLDTDWKEFDGHERNDRNAEFFTRPEGWNNRPHSMFVYLPCRTGIVFKKVDDHTPFGHVWQEPKKDTPAVQQTAATPKIQS